MSTNEEHFASPVALAAADSAADMLESPSQREQRRQAGPKSKADGGADGAGISQKHERRLTASPSSYHNLLDRIDLEMPEKTRGGEEDVAVGGSGESGSGDDRRPVDGPFCIGSGFRVSVRIALGHGGFWGLCSDVNRFSVCLCVCPSALPCVSFYLYNCFGVNLFLLCTCDFFV